MATATVTLTGTATPSVTLSNPLSLDEFQLLGTPTINIASTATVDGLMGLEEGLYVIVEPTTSATDNGTALLAAYTTAKALTGLTATNRATVIVPPGTYDMGASALVLDTQYVDLMGMTGDPNAVILKNTANGPLDLNSTDVNISGIWCYGTLDASGEDTTCHISDCIFGVSGSVNALDGNNTITCTWNRCRFENVGKTTNHAIIGGVCDSCGFEGSNALYVAAGTQMRYCTSEVTLTGSTINAKIYHCSLAAGLSGITNDISPDAYNVVDTDVAV